MREVDGQEVVGWKHGHDMILWGWWVDGDGEIWLLLERGARCGGGAGT